MDAYQFEVAKSGYAQIDPSINPGRPYDERYHNLGQLMTPYEGKGRGTVGDYGPPQATVYYTQNNRNYPYPLDSDSRPGVYIPMSGTCAFGRPGFFKTYEPDYPDVYVPENYFSPARRHPTGHTRNVFHSEDYDPSRGDTESALAPSARAPNSSDREGFMKLQRTYPQLGNSARYFTKNPPPYYRG